MLREAELEIIKLSVGMLAVGKMITELNLRSVSGASIVGIDRAGHSIVNPPPTEELIGGDEVLLLGRPEQLTAARQLLTAVAE